MQLTHGELMRQLPQRVQHVQPLKLLPLPVLPGHL
jgi:hypothetical protein